MSGILQQQQQQQQGVRFPFKFSRLNSNLSPVTIRNNNNNKNSNRRDACHARRKTIASAGRTMTMVAKEPVKSPLKDNNNKMKSPKAAPPALEKHGHFTAFLRKIRLYPKRKVYFDGDRDRLELDDPTSYFEMLDDSEILTTSAINNLGQMLPPIAIGNPWKLSFSTTRDGFCLHSLYRKMSLYPTNTPVLLIIQDTNDRVFGALSSNALKPSNSFYGTSQTFLFRMSPTFEVFKWNGDNFYFVKGDTDCVMFGSGNGNFGLWLDGDLNKGRSQHCETFGSPPLVPEEDFTVKTIECWTFERTKKASIGSLTSDDIWISHSDTSSNCTDDLGSPLERSNSLRTKAEQEIVNSFVVKLTDELRTALHCHVGGADKPELIIGRSEILDIEDVERISQFLPNQNCHWFLSYSTLLSENSLETLYSRASGGPGGPVLILIKDTERRVFGALMSHPPNVSTEYYGGHDTVLFQFRPTFKAYNWAGNDTSFMLGGNNSFKIGASDEQGVSAITINESLTEGQTTECATFDSPPLVPESTFKIKILECWHFESHQDGELLSA